ncbi:Ankyrin repeat, SAM and basic leucine zipper domain-containing protein 1 [Sciurus carolinensis]|uniref:Ankyrin repeat, SAM and basic leucine zipper domain-containing protein 1 n=1 Tax=Sciurus carolinensis TaxID=30640 RepID=A0AA41MYQ7_SCICA|nr:Ankyrin repeat, SAM and basic leucine zipper domain-containing protein 1 [Sciurus carolinensis]
MAVDTAVVPLRGVAVAGGEESSDSEDEGWHIGYLDPASQKLKSSLPTEEKNETFKKALTTGDTSLVEELLDSGISVHSNFRYGWTPLMYAASVANVEMVRLLLDRGANASFDKDKQTVLMTACSACGSEEQILKCVELLLSRNADPNVTCRRLMTPIMYAARDGHPQVVALLVAHGADVNAQDENGYAFGINNKDQQKILAAVKELEVEEINFGELPEVAKLEVSALTFSKIGCLALKSYTVQLPLKGRVLLHWLLLCQTEMKVMAVSLVFQKAFRIITGVQHYGILEKNVQEN